MVAYSFKKQFAAPILDETKIGTIRNDRKRHARLGEELQLYTGMRTKSCKLIARKTCLSVHPIVIEVGTYCILSVTIERHVLPVDLFNGFAQSDGFSDIESMWKFWIENHGQGLFEGVWIRWA